MGRHANDRARAFAEYTALRKKNVDVLADLAIGNFVEMRDRTGSRIFLLRKKTEKVLHRLFPKWYVPLYSMATFSRIPYTEAVERAGLQDRVVVGVAGFIVLILFVIALLLIF
jgi:kynurenine 3-monooxygenase